MNWEAFSAAYPKKSIKDRKTLLEEPETMDKPHKLC